MKKATLLLLVVALMLLAGCAPSASTQSVEPTTEPTPTVEPTPTPEPTPEPTPQYYFSDGVLQSRDARVEIVDWEVIQPGEYGNEFGDVPVIAFTYDTTNVSGIEGLTPTLGWISFFYAYQDNNPNYMNELEVAATLYDEYLDTQLVEIKKGGTVRNAIMYELDDLTTPVLLEAYRGIGGEFLGDQTFDIASAG